VRALAQGGVDCDRNKMRLRVMVLADGPSSAAPAAFEIAKCGKTEPMPGRQGLEGDFDVEFGSDRRD